MKVLFGGICVIIVVAFCFIGGVIYPPFEKTDDTDGVQYSSKVVDWFN